MIFTVDFGGTRIKLGLIENGAVYGYQVIDSFANRPFVKWIPLLRDELQSLCDAARLAVKDIEGMIWAFPLIIEPGLRHATCGFGKYEDIIQHNFCKLVEQQFQIPLLLENDARAALIGEWQHGSARDRENAVMITLGTGLGTGVIFEGKPMRGRSGMAGNLGGLSITHLHAEDCGDRAPGCIESQVATWALPQKIRQMKGLKESDLAFEPHPDYLAVFNLAAQGDALACRLRDRALEAWGALALNMIQAYDPECVVFGGGIMASEDIILPAIREFINAYAFQAGGSVEIVKAQLGDRAALVGGEWIWKTNGKKNAVQLR
jgi:glucokinase